jgi:hypothetical protein
MCEVCRCSLDVGVCNLFGVYLKRQRVFFLADLILSQCLTWAAAWYNRELMNTFVSHVSSQCAFSHLCVFGAQGHLIDHLKLHKVRHVVVVGVDIVPEFLHLARVRHPGHVFVQADLATLHSSEARALLVAALDEARYKYAHHDDMRTSRDTDHPSSTCASVAANGAGTTEQLESPNDPLRVARMMETSYSIAKVISPMESALVADKGPMVDWVLSSGMMWLGPDTTEFSMFVIRMLRTLVPLARFGVAVNFLDETASQRYPDWYNGMSRSVRKLTSCLSAFEFTCHGKSHDVPS